MKESFIPLSRQENFPSHRHLKWLIAFLLAYFGLRLLFFAITIASYVPPDEVTHLGLSQIFSKLLFLPDNTPASYQYGLVTNIPWLYYWVMGKLLVLNVFGIQDLLFLRLLNLPLAFGVVFFAWRVLRLVTNDRLAQLLLVVVMTNTLMLSFLSASVSYDNLANLFAVMSIYYLMAFFRERSGRSLGLSLLCQLAGCLTKSSFLPLALMLTVLLVVRECKALPELFTVVTRWVRTVGPGGVVLVAGILIGVLLNLHLYGGNYLHYGKVVPEMSDVLPLENVMQNRLAARDTIFMQFKEGNISYRQALQKTSFIRHEGDRAGTIYLIQNYHRRQSHGGQLLGPLAYSVPWGERVLSTVFGIMGHRSMHNRFPTLLPILGLLVLSAFAFLRRWRPGATGGVPTCLAVLTVGYVVFIMYVFNYRNYLYYENFDVALQGRYIFPIIGPAYVLFSYYLMRLFRGGEARLVLASLAAVIFILSDLPFFLYHATPQWFSVFYGF